MSEILSSSQSKIERGRIVGPSQFLQFVFNYDTESNQFDTETDCCDFIFGQGAGTNGFFDYFYKAKQFYNTVGLFSSVWDGTQAGAQSFYVFINRKTGTAGISGYVEGYNLSYAEFEELTKTKMFQISKILIQQQIAEENTTVYQNVDDVMGTVFTIITRDVGNFETNAISYENFKNPMYKDGVSNLIVPAKVIVGPNDALGISLPGMKNYLGLLNVKVRLKVSFEISPFSY